MTILDRLSSIETVLHDCHKYGWTHGCELALSDLAAVKEELGLTSPRHPVASCMGPKEPK